MGMPDDALLFVMTLNDVTLFVSSSVFAGIASYDNGVNIPLSSNVPQ
jgi:hypothetical protein